MEEILEELKKAMRTELPYVSYDGTLNIKNREWNDALHFAIKKLESSKAHTDKVIIPQFVADLIEHYKRAGDCLGELLAHIEYEDLLKPKLKILSEVVKWVYPDDFSDNEDRIDLIARAWLDGYEVEKEKRYYIINKENNATLMTFELSDVVGEEIIEFVYAYSENETIHFDSKEKAELIAHFVGDFVEVEEVTK